MYDTKKEKKPLQPQQALARLMALCSRSEKCTEDARILLERWGIAAEHRTGIVRALVEQRYIDDRRYATAFVRDKIAHNKWGRRKISDALRMKRIPTDDIEQALAALPGDAEREQLLLLLRRKRASSKAENDYRMKEKLVRYALSKGFLLDDILETVDGIMAEK